MSKIIIGHLLEKGLEKPPTHGGKRPGAGRPKGSDKQKASIYVNQESIRTLRKLGNGSLSAGVEKLVSDWVVCNG